MGDQQLVGGNRRELPDDTVRDILSRLPLRTILRYQLVCRRWKDLTSTPYFFQMQKTKNKKSSIPVILLEDKTNIKRYSQVSVDLTEKRVRTVLINSVYRIQFSWDRLMLLRSYLEYMVFNPITREKVKIKPPTLLIQPCGLFFHPIVEEYCILWIHWPLQPSGFKILTLGKKMCWRDLCTRLFLPNATKYAHVNSPVVVNDILYWISFYLEEHKKDWSCQIFAFVIRREEISFVSYPESNYQFSNQHYSYPYSYSWNGTSLVEMKDKLSLVQSSLPENSQETCWAIHIWILKDYTNGLWTKIYTINDDCHALSRPVAFMNDELILQKINPGCLRILAHDLELGTIKHLTNKDIPGPIMAWAHVPSIVSVRSRESN